MEPAPDGKPASARETPDSAMSEDGQEPHDMAYGVRMEAVEQRQAHIEERRTVRDGNGMENNDDGTILAEEDFEDMDDEAADGEDDEIEDDEDDEDDDIEEDEVEDDEEEEVERGEMELEEEETSIEEEDVDEGGTQEQELDEIDADGGRDISETNADFLPSFGDGRAAPSKNHIAVMSDGKPSLKLRLKLNPSKMTSEIQTITANLSPDADLRRDARLSRARKKLEAAVNETAPANHANPSKISLNSSGQDDNIPDVKDEVPQTRRAAASHHANTRTNVVAPYGPRQHSVNPPAVLTKEEKTMIMNSTKLAGIQPANVPRPIDRSGRKCRSWMLRAKVLTTYGRPGYQWKQLSWHGSPIDSDFVENKDEEKISLAS